MKALDIVNLKKIYSNQQQALKGVTFSVESGDFFALLGPNGAGKSTIIGILTSIVNKTSGKVTVYGHDIDKNFPAAKACIGVVPQEYNLNIFHKVFDVLVTQAGYYGVPAKLAKTRAEKYLRQLDLWDKRDHIVRTLSGGMKRRLMIARALIHEPKMLILDEPTAGVDIELRRSMWKFLITLNQQGITIILTTHYLEEAENLCRHVAIINRGELIENNSMSAILKKLESETFIFYLTEALKAPPTLTGYTCRSLDSVTLEIDVPHTLGLSDLFEKLNQQKIKINSMRNKTNRLEELFVRLTTRET